MTLFWHGAARAEEVVNLGPLALIQPLLDQLDIASIIDRHLPPDPQLEFSHGQVSQFVTGSALVPAHRFDQYLGLGSENRRRHPLELVHRQAQR